MLYCIQISFSQIGSNVELNSVRVSEEIEAAILSGQFKPRERLIEMDLISRFGVSRTVIREALKRLEAKGLVRTAPYRGAIVADLTVEEVEEIIFFGRNWRR